MISDVTGIFQNIFNGINQVYIFMSNVRFSAFGFNFSLLGIFLSFMLLVVIIRALKHGFDDEVTSRISFNRSIKLKKKYSEKLKNKNLKDNSNDSKKK